MTISNTLVLSAFHPSSRGIGDILLRDVCRYYPRGKMAFFCVSPPVALDAEFNWIPIAFAPRPAEGGYWALGERGERLTASIRQAFVAKRDLSVMIQQAVDFGKQLKVDTVWAVLDNATIIKIAKPIADALGAKLAVTVWDPPGSRLEGHTCSDTIKERLMAQFSELMRSAIMCSAVSENMKDEYDSEFGTDCLILRKSVPRFLWRNSEKADGPGERIRIVFTGLMYADTAIGSLLNALADANWMLCGKPVSLRVLSGKIAVGNYRPMQIEFLGYRDEEETIEEVSRADIAYLPYGFESQFAESARLCSPSKLSTYLAGGAPVFYHGPQASQPIRFFEERPVAKCCCSTDASDILRALASMIEDNEFRSAAARARRDALEKEFDLQVYVNRFARLVGTDPSAMLPVDRGN